MIEKEEERKKKYQSEQSRRGQSAGQARQDKDQTGLVYYSTPVRVAEVLVTTSD